MLGHGQVYQLRPLLSETLLFQQNMEEEGHQPVGKIKFLLSVGIMY